MELQRALEDGIEACDYLGRCGHHDSAKFRQAVAKLRAALPFIKAAVEHADEFWTSEKFTLPNGKHGARQRMMDAYRAMKEAK